MSLTVQGGDRQVVENEALRSRRIAAGLTQEGLAKHVVDRLRKLTDQEPGFDANTVSRLERGRITWPGQAYRDALCHVLRVDSPQQLGLYSRKARPDMEKVSTSDRRTLVLGSLAGFLPAPAAPPTRLGMGDLDALTERVHALGALDRQSGGAPVRYFAFSELHKTLDLTGASMRPAVRARLCSAIANLANLAAWSSFDAGLAADSRPTFNLGIQAAREAGDADAVCHLATNLARQEIQERDPERALAMATLAEGQVSSAALAMVNAVKAQAFALKGDESQALRRMSESEAIFAAAADPHDGPRWTWSITSEKISSDNGYALYLLSRTTGRYPPDLLRMLRTAVAGTDPSRARVKAMMSARLATVLYRQGVRDEAEQHASAASMLASTVGSARLDGALAEMRRAAR